MLKKRFIDLDFWQEFILAIRFGLVGIFATAVHITIATLLLMHSEVNLIAVNTLAFLTAFGVSFLGNYLWTFRAPGSPRRAILRFFLIAVGAYAANTMLLLFLTSQRWLSTFESMIISATIVPIISFSLSRVWGFSKNMSDRFFEPNCQTKK